MATIINATTTGLTVTPDNSGQLTLSANGVTALTANTTGYLNFPYQPTIGGVQWPAFSATSTVGQSVTGSTWTKIQFATELFDTANCYDPTTNYRFTPNVAGYYLITLTLSTNVSTAAYAGVYKNGSIYRRGYYSNPGIGAAATITTFVSMNGSTDYVEAYVWQTSSVSLYTSASDYEFSGCLLRAA